MLSKRLSGVAIACALGLSGCSSLGMSSGASSGGTDLLDAVKSIAANCTGQFAANLTFAPPLPPSGSLVVNQSCGTTASAPKPVVSPPSGGR